LTDEKKIRIHTLQEMIQLIILALPREISAREFYLKAATKATNGESARLFRTLAEQENGHEVYLRKILSEMKAELKELKKQGKTLWWN
jgi:rubrerythrin